MRLTGATLILVIYNEVKFGSLGKKVTLSFCLAPSRLIGSSRDIVVGRN